jgi:uncharacterized protein YigE (DUF2233 family)
MRPPFIPPVMIKTVKTLSFFLVFIISVTFGQGNDEKFLSYIVDSKKADVQLYWKDDRGQILKSIQNLRQFINGTGEELKFAMNGGMYKTDNTPQGLFIQNRIAVTPLDTLSGNGNFYMKPNGIFYITTDNEAVVCTTTDFVNEKIKFATQSGPMLLINGAIHPAFKKGSANLNIRNGVGILPDGQVIFALSKREVNFYDFAEFFQKMNCKNALYLDGFVSRAYLPEQNWQQLDGNFGVIIGVVD